MTVSSIGDLSRSFMLQNRSVELRERLTTLTSELSSGRTSDIRGVLSGNHNLLVDLQGSLQTLSAYSVAAEEAAFLTEAMQLSLEAVQNLSGDLGLDLILAGGGPIGIVSGDPAQNASTRLESMINALNDDIAGKSLFSGAATNRKPLLDATELTTQLRAIVSGQTTPQDIIDAAQSWFDDPAGFDSLIYVGSNSPLSAISLSETEEVDLDVRANNAAIKNSLMFAAISALSNDPAISLSVEDQSQLLRLTGLGLQQNQENITALRAKIGYTEDRIQTIKARTEAEVMSSEMSLSSLLETDPYKVATELESVQFQLQALYSVTVKSSKLSLVNFL